MLLQSLKKAEASQQGSTKRKLSGVSENGVTEGAGKVQASASQNNKKKKKKFNTEKVYNTSNIPSLLSLGPPQDRTLEHRSNVQSDIAIGQAISGLSDTLGLLSSIVADRIG